MTFLSIHILWYKRASKEALGLGVSLGKKLAVAAHGVMSRVPGVIVVDRPRLK